LAIKQLQKPMRKREMETRTQRREALCDLITLIGELIKTWDDNLIENRLISEVFLEKNRGEIDDLFARFGLRWTVDDVKKWRKTLGLDDMGFRGWGYTKKRNHF
jgi:hypothetical protein